MYSCKHPMVELATANGKGYGECAPGMAIYSMNCINVRFLEHLGKNGACSGSTWWNSLLLVAYCIATFHVLPPFVGVAPNL